MFLIINPHSVNSRTVLMVKMKTDALTTLISSTFKKTLVWLFLRNKGGITQQQLLAPTYAWNLKNSTAKPSTTGL